MTIEGFEDAASRLLYLAQGRVRSGELSERRLAKLAGLSQPHLHNILAGKRGLPYAAADKLLRALDLTVADLLVGRRPGRAPLGWLEAPLGGGRAFPRIVHAPPAHFFDAARLDALEEPCLAKVAPEEYAMAPTLLPGDDVLLECAWRARRWPRGESVYALEWEGRGYICRCRSLGSALLTAVESNWSEGLPPSIPLAGRKVEDVVRGEVVWFGRVLA
ncbi:MAG: helix-turn-helix transcriptional regulator [Bryobacterales bacterium]|nr:helix-turn-helix transcriptional regulator [Bryobacterales bacterium]